MPLRTHLTVLKWSAALYADSVVFKIPKTVSSNGQAQHQWDDVTYRDFLLDVERSARYWKSILAKENISQRSVVGLWLGGMTYMDSRIHPQLFSLRLPSPEIIFELMHRAGAKALIYDVSYASIVHGCYVTTLTAVDIFSAPDVQVSLAAVIAPESRDDIAMVFHTSGSTSGSPKLVTCTYGWLDTIVAKANTIGVPCRPGRQDVIVSMGSMCHIGQTLTLISALQHGTCTIQPTQIAFSSDELVQMVRQCGLNRLMQFATFLSIHLRNSRHDPNVLTLLKGLDEVLFAGLALPQEDEEWARCGAMLISAGGQGSNSLFLRPIEGTKYAFVPITSSSAGDEATHYNANTVLLELVILSDSGDCPHPSLRQKDGHFHTGDLFSEVAPGSYLFRGRDDDWIKSENSLRCDTRAIEDNVRATCGDLVAECVVVGYGKPSPALFVEPKGEIEGEKLRKDIIRRTRHFHSRRYMHERIVDPKFVVVVPKGTLPRTATKGNIRRRAVEEKFKIELDRVYGTNSKA
ncbi:acetyl-CoA synthetase-like protein [Fomitopsis serialis]|uniref:acetyl-CoA synthetase-like protein n=1 Tax=Fomitopsis serialis TaxID=139415 RepID=UPI002008C953|nr:acetyl-CoA synthetase-like protein [Neoantrodia serialis]KAH9937144.1 acetyl-CoA synthetase-like protein [Neoantrodia serialis]